MWEGQWRWVQVGDDMARTAVKFWKLRAAQVTNQQEDRGLSPRISTNWILPTTACVWKRTRSSKKEHSLVNSWLQPLRQKILLSRVQISLQKPDNQWMLFVTKFESLPTQQTPQTPYTNAFIPFPGLCTARGPRKTAGHKVLFHLSLLDAFWF